MKALKYIKVKGVFLPAYCWYDTITSVRVVVKNCFWKYLKHHFKCEHSEHYGFKRQLIFILLLQSMLNIFAPPSICTDRPTTASYMCIRGRPGNNGPLYVLVTLEGYIHHLYMYIFSILALFTFMIF